MSTRPLPQPLDGCEECKKRYDQIVELYRMWYSVPGDPGAGGLFEQAQQEYLLHWNVEHKDISRGEIK